MLRYLAIPARRHRGRVNFSQVELQLSFREEIW
jgi:hypothetical protein